jgi:cell division septation protein DedD
VKNEPAKAEVKKPAEKQAQKETAPPSKGKAAEGAYAVSVGIFRSQKFVFEAEEKLRELKLPSYRRESKKNGEGIRVRVTAGDAARKKAAAEALRGVGYSLSESAGGLDVYVLYKEEADQVAQIVRSAGAEAKAESVKGPLPMWKVFAGPMDRQEADKAAARIKAAGMECFVTRNEP